MKCRLWKETKAGVGRWHLVNSEPDASSCLGSIIKSNKISLNIVR